MIYDLPKHQEQFMRDKFGYKYDILKDLCQIRELEKQESITTQQLKEIIQREQVHRLLARRLRNLQNKKVRG